MPALQHRPATERETTPSSSATRRGCQRSSGRWRAERTHSAGDPSSAGWETGLKAVATGTGLSAEPTVTLAAVREGAVLDPVGGLSVGKVLYSETVIGTQSASGSTCGQYATQFDVVGTQAAVEQFVRANHPGESRRRVRDQGT